MRTGLIALALMGCSSLSGIGFDETDPRLEELREGGTNGLLLSEVLDHPTNGYKYVEICNRSTRSIDLTELQLQRYANGNVEPASFTLSGTLDAGQALIVVGSSGASSFELDAGTPATFTSSVVSGNGDDVYALSDDGEVFDVFGVIGIDGSDESWEYTDGVVHRNEPVATGTADFVQVEWEHQDGVNGTPFACGEPIPDPEPPAPPVVGTLLISEIMDHADQSSVKYVEICNRSSEPVDLGGAELQRYTNGTTNASTVALEPVMLAPGAAYVVVNPSGVEGFSMLYDTPIHQVSALASGNGDDAYALVLNGAMVDLFGMIGVDGTSTPWEYKDAVALRAGDALAGRTVWSADEWTVTGVGAASPGACAGDLPPPPDPDDEDPDCPDADGDGYGNCIDCDDDDRSVHPGAVEACDGVDNDCDGWVPEGDEDLNFDGQLDCEVCDEEGLWHTTKNLYGQSLRSYLRNFASGQSCGWNSSRRKINGLIDADNGVVECVYTDTTANAQYATTTGNINIEHTWPQSLGASAWPAKCDMHHLYPADMFANSARSSHPFGVPEPFSVTWQDGDSRVGRLNGQVVFEPPDEHKGNVARSLFYMNLTYGFSFDGAYQARMKNWHALDPVDLNELDRTQRIAAEQGMVNPLVACPHLMDRL